MVAEPRKLIPGSPINSDRPDAADAIILGAGYDRTSSFGTGSLNAPGAIVSCLEHQVETFDPEAGVDPAKDLRTAYVEVPLFRNLQTPEEMVERVMADHRRYYPKGKFVITLGGDHSVTNGPLCSIANGGMAKKTTILHIDAHLDLRDTDADFHTPPHGPFSHACVMRRAAELGYHIVHVGARSFSREEYDFARERGHRLFRWDVKSRPSVNQIISALTPHCYISLDVDGIDPAHMPSTGTPVPGGLEWWYVVDLLRETFKNTRVLGADIVEVIPGHGSKQTEWGAAFLCTKMLTFHAASIHPDRAHRR